MLQRLFTFLVIASLFLSPEVVLAEEVVESEVSVETTEEEVESVEETQESASEATQIDPDPDLDGDPQPENSSTDPPAVEYSGQSGDTSFGTTSYTYDDNGNVLSTIMQDGTTITYTYDDLNRLLTESGVEAITYSYDCANSVGYLCSVTTPNITTTYDWDNRGRATSEDRLINGTNYITATTYDDASNPLTITYPNNEVITYTYNDANYVETVTSSTHGPLITNHDYGPTGATTVTNYANGITTTNIYDPQ